MAITKLMCVKCLSFTESKCCGLCKYGLREGLVQCQRCGDWCEIEGEFPKFDAWCWNCNDYANYDLSEYTADWLAAEMDRIYNKLYYCNIRQEYKRSDCE